MSKGSGISVWGTIQLLQPNTPTFVVSSYSINNGPTTIFNATEKAGYQFQQKLFQSAELDDTVPHTIVVTLVNNGTFFIDYFLIVPAGATSTSATSSSTTTGAGAQSNSSGSAGLRVGPIVGGTISGVLLIIIVVILALLLRRKRRKDKNRKRESFFGRVVELALNFFFYMYHL